MAEKKRQKDGANYRQAYYAKFRLISRQKGAEQKQKGKWKSGKVGNSCPMDRKEQN